MRKQIFSLQAVRVLIIPAILMIAACSPITTIRNVVEPPANWDFIQSVGGLSVGQPRLVDGIFWLPLNLDLSGNRQITVAPTLNNSGKKCIRTLLRQADGLTTPSGYYDLYLQVYAGPVSKSAEGGCDEVPMFVGSLTPPLAHPENVTFRIWYKDYIFTEHKLAEFKLQ